MTLPTRIAMRYSSHRLGVTPSKGGTIGSVARASWQSGLSLCSCSHPASEEGERLQYRAPDPPCKRSPNSVSGPLLGRGECATRLAPQPPIPAEPACNPPPGDRRFPDRWYKGVAEVCTY